MFCFTLLNKRENWNNFISCNGLCFKDLMAYESTNIADLIQKVQVWLNWLFLLVGKSFGYCRISIVFPSSFLPSYMSRSRCQIKISRTSFPTVAEKTVNIHSIYISTTEMRSLWQSKTYLKNAASLLNRDCVSQEGLDLSKEVLWVSVGQRAAKLWSVKL